MLETELNNLSAPSASSALSTGDTQHVIQRHKLAVSAVLGVALLVRILILGLVVFSPQRAFNGGDSAQYTLLAQNMVENGDFSFSTTPPYQADITRTPGYPAFLAIFYVLAGHQNSPILIIAAQVILGMINVYLVLVIGRQLLSPGLAIIGALLYAIAPAAAIYDGLVMSETLCATFLLLGLWLTLRAGKERPWLYATGAGIAFGLSVLVRPIGLYFIPLPMAVVLIRQGVNRRAVGLALVMCATFVLTLLPWYIRNYVQYRAVIFTSLANSNLLIYNVGSIEAQRQHISWADAKQQLWEEFAQRLAAMGNPKLDFAQTSALEGDIAIHHILAHPVDAFVYQSLDMINSFRPGYNMTTLLLHDQVIDANNLDTVRNASLLEKLIYAFITVYYVALYALIALGLLCLVYQRNWAALVACGLISFWFLYLPGSAGNARFRAPVEGLLALVAAVGAGWLATRVEKIRRSPVVHSESAG